MKGLGQEMNIGLVQEMNIGLVQEMNIGLVQGMDRIKYKECIRIQGTDSIWYKG